MKITSERRLHQQIAYSVMTARLDIDGYRAHYGCFPPGMFKNEDALDEWIFDMQYRPNGCIIKKSRLNQFNPKNVLLLSTEAGSKIHYESLWVRASWGDYREAMKEYLQRNRAGDKGVKSVDADHVINRERVLSNHPDAWLMLMPVPLSANRAFGSAIEKKLPPIDAYLDSSLIEPFVILKTFSQNSIKNLGELESLAAEIAGQMEGGETKDAALEVALSEYSRMRGWSREGASTD